MTVRFKDFCIDVNDASVAGPFWAAALGRDLEIRDNGNGVLTGNRPEQTIWLNLVPEPKTVKNRTHLDLNTISVEALVELGATVVDAESFPWTVLLDPEGGEFCRLGDRPDEPAPADRLSELAFDTNDSVAITAWWAEQFGATTGREEQWDYSWLDPAGGLPWPVVFCTVPEPKTVKNRIHWDVWGVTGELLDAGATLVRARDDEIRWDQLADPDGNEFCVFAPQ